jgi:AcrR family transcriptional regulator
LKKKAPDRRVVRTQHSLHRALNSLILEKGYEKATVRDIIGQANVGRSTFYAHHGSKEALLLSGLEHLRAALLAVGSDRTRADGSPLLAFSPVFFAHVHGYRAILVPILASEGGPAVRRKLKRLLTEVVQQELPVARSAVPRAALVSFTVDALLSILWWWFELGAMRTPAEVDAIFRRLALPALAAAGVTDRSS